MRAWRGLPPEQRLAAYAALGLFLTMFLPWYQRNFFTVIGGKLLPAADSQTAWAAFSWVEAAVLLVAGGVLMLLFNRAEGRAFHVPGGDGGVIAVAGVWTGLLIIWRIFDKQGASSQGQYATTYGIEWGIFVALAVAAFLVYAGNRIRAAPSSPTSSSRCRSTNVARSSQSEAIRLGAAMRHQIGSVRPQRSRQRSAGRQLFLRTPRTPQVTFATANAKYALTAPTIRIPVRIRVRDLITCP